MYQEACELTAYLCLIYNIDPFGYTYHNGIKVPNILCHADSHTLGLGCDHGDIMHWFPKYGKNMDTVRNDVAELLKSAIPDEEEEEMTQEKFNEMMNVWIAESEKLPPEYWSKDARKWAETNGLIKGDGNGNGMYKRMMTREEFVTVLYRAFKEFNLI